ncbi:unnamed protein product [Notodromas monacha]|uniref:Alkaline phosphatase n=1 Tax=Notodromas monacha TaxID=399045 RepID=A0A7R9BW88_9CRUS|nr:unnamed protein product [Notodromas monacha]CAG0922888.1 unnamed protein product [Notodromas monacha]
MFSGNVSYGKIFGIAVTAFVIIQQVSTSPTRYHRFKKGPTAPVNINPDEYSKEYWNKLAKNELDKSMKINAKLNVARAKNVIMFLGDGMSIPTTTAARILKGQLTKIDSTGEEASLVFEDFPHIALSKTYNVDFQVPDSAGTGTAYLTGVKANSGTVGVTAAVPRYDCNASNIEENQVDSFLQWAIDDGRNAGLVTTTRITHATPAAAYAHCANRDWECVGFEPWEGPETELPDHCKDIATQLVNGKTGKGLKVIFGGGRHAFDGTIKPTENDPKGSCVRNVKESLIEEWQELHKDEKAHYIEKKTELEKLDAKNVDRVLGEEASLVFEDFPHIALSKTYNVDFQVPDSAGTGTAYLTGVKANSGTVGVTAAVPRYDCNASNIEENQVDSFLQWAIDDGRNAGLVTTTRITHATPAAAYAHCANRDWECVGFEPWEGPETELPDHCKDIATQLVNGKTGKGLKVIFGGGRHAFDGTIKPTENDPKGSCVRNVKESLIEEWQELHKDEKAHYIEKKTELEKLDAKNVEGGRIDHAHHALQMNAAFLELLDMESAVSAAMEMTDPDETLIIVTADHSHTMSFGGWPQRGTPLHGMGGDDDDGIAYLKMAYANGPRPYLYNETQRPDPQGEAVEKPDYQPLVPVNLYSETHGADDVAIYAQGPMAHMFHGVHEQNYIAHVMGYASCTGQYRNNCRSSASGKMAISCAWLFVLSMIVFAIPGRNF